MRKFKERTWMIGVLFAMAQGAIAGNDGSDFTGKFNVERAMEEIYGNHHLKIPDNSLAIVMRMEAIAHSKWNLGQFCSIKSLREHDALDANRLKNLSSQFIEIGLEASFEAFAFDVLPFNVRCIEKTFLVTQSSFCGANSCPAVIGVFLWARSAKGWRLESSAPCMFSMGGSSGVYSGNVALRKISDNKYGLSFQNTIGDKTSTQLVAVDKYGTLRVISDHNVIKRNFMRQQASGFGPHLFLQLFEKF